MKDEWDNECPYDFKNIMFYRKTTNDSIMRYTIPCKATDEDATALYTFYSDVGERETLIIDASAGTGVQLHNNPCRDNIIEPSLFINSYDGSYRYVLPNNIFSCQAAGVASVKIGLHSCANTVSKFSIKIGKYCYGNEINSYDVTLGDRCEDNKISVNHDINLEYDNKGLKITKNVESVIVRQGVSYEDLDSYEELTSGITVDKDSNDSLVFYRTADLKESKQDKLISGTNIKTINGESILGSGDISAHSVLYTPQTLTDAQKNQVVGNLGGLDNEAFKELIGAFAAGTVWIDTDGRWHNDPVNERFTTLGNKQVAEWLSIGSGCTTLYDSGARLSNNPVYKVYPKYWDLSHISGGQNFQNVFNNADFGDNPDLSRWDISKITNMKYSFLNIKAGTFDISMLNTSNVTNMDGMFNNSTIDRLIINGIDTSNVTQMGFTNSNISEIDISELDLNSLTTMFNMFANSSAERILLPEITGSGITNMSACVHNCPNLTAIDLSGINTENMTIFQKCPNNCPSLKTFGLPSIPNGCTMYDNFYKSTNIENIFMREGATFAVSLPYLSSLNKLTAESVKTLLSHASPTPDDGATLSFNSALYNSFSAEDKAEIDALRNTAVGNG